MSDYSENLDFSPTRQAKIAACEKLRDTVTGISALHKSLLDESLAVHLTHRNSFLRNLPDEQSSHGYYEKRRKQAKIAACEKLRDAVTGISALHKSLLDESLASSPTHRNSFSEINRMSTQAMTLKKEEM
ncbi:hypothetical protein TNIN_88081, partial [Trichonephila inaurata madagascariensis]